MKRSLLVVTVILAVVACRNHRAIDRERANKLFDEIVIDTPPGMSGLAVDDHGVLWSIPERDHVLVEIRLAGNKATTKRYPLEGVPETTDTEGLAWLGDHHFAISTEGQKAATAGVLFADLEGEKAIVKRVRMLTPAELGVELQVNHGAEGACGFGNDVMLAIEAVGALPDGARYAPIARLRGEKLTIYPIRLTTQSGKLSSIDCKIAPDGTAHVWAIERHFGVSRVLRFDLPPEGARSTSSVITPTVDLDLAPVLNDTLNLEGIAELPDGRLVIINDNQGSLVEGPTELLVLRPH